MTNLKRIIDEKGVQQRWLAEEVGVTEVSMSRYVSGERIPKAPMAIRMADALGVDVKELYGWDDKHVVGEDKDMTTEEAADILRNAAWLGTYADRKQIEEAVEMAISALTAQADSKELSFTHKALDTVSRQAAIDALDNEYRCTDKSDDWDGLKTAMLIIENLPPAQPEIVRCKECVNADENYHCDYMTTWNYGDCFCSYGKRRNDERSD